MSTPYGGSDPSSLPPQAPDYSGYPGAPQGTGGPQGPGAPQGPAGPQGPGGPQGPTPAQGPGGPQKPKHTGRNIGIGCAIAAVLLLLLGGCGALGYALLNRGSDDPSPAASSSSSAPAESSSAAPSESSSAAPTDASTSATPSSAAPTSADPAPATDGAALTIDAQEEVTSVETDSGTYTPTQGAFVGVTVTLTNNGTLPINFSPENFTMVDANGTTYTPTLGTSDYGAAQVAPGDSAVATLYADVASGTSITDVTYAS